MLASAAGEPGKEFADVHFKQINWAV